MVEDVRLALEWPASDRVLRTRRRQRALGRRAVGKDRRADAGSSVEHVAPDAFVRAAVTEPASGRMRPPLRENRGYVIMTESKPSPRTTERQVSTDQFEIVHQKSEAFYPTYERKSDLQAPDALLSRLRPRRRPQTHRRSSRRPRSAGRHDPRQPRRLLRLRLLLLRRRQRASRPWTCSRRRHRV